jgi:hypothetical protein
MKITSRRIALFIAVSALCNGSARAQTNADPAAEALALELLTADRAFAAAAPKLNVIDALGAMFAADVIMPAPPGSSRRTARRR